MAWAPGAVVTVGGVGLDATAQQALAQACYDFDRLGVNLTLYYAGTAPAAVEVYNATLGGVYLAYTTPVTSDGRNLVSASITLDSLFCESGGYSQASVLGHELCHAVGLGHNGADPNSLMYPSLVPGVTRTYGPDEAVTLLALYGPG